MNWNNSERSEEERGGTVRGDLAEPQRRETYDQASRKSGLLALGSLRALRLTSALPISRRERKERGEGNLARGLCAGALVFTFAMALQRAEACGPDFPNWLLAGGDGAVLVAPEGNFAAELSRMNLGQPREQAVPPIAVKRRRSGL